MWLVDCHDLPKAPSPQQVHAGARFKKRIEANIYEAMELMHRALDIRQQCEEKFPNDLGMKEDIIKNFIDMIKINGLTNDELQQYIHEARLRLDYIRKNEGMSTRRKAKIYQALPWSRSLSR